MEEERLNRYIKLHSYYINKYNKKFNNDIQIYKKHIYFLFHKINTYYLEQLSKIKKNEFEIVISKYNENIEWTFPYKHLITIYNKSDIFLENSIKLPNVGRESHTFLYHIITNWDNLADKTLFTQGEMSDIHQPYPVPIYYFYPYKYVSNIFNSNIVFRDGPGNHIKHQGKWLKEYETNNMKSSIITFNEFFSIFRNNKIKNFNDIKWSHGAIFSVSRDLIKQNSIDVYKYLYKLVCNHKNPEEGHYFERCWYYIFNQGRIII
jgi:hypothetical protein